MKSDEIGWNWMKFWFQFHLFFQESKRSSVWTNNKAPVPFLYLIKGVHFKIIRMKSRCLWYPSLFWRMNQFAWNTSSSSISFLEFEGSISVLFGWNLGSSLWYPSLFMADDPICMKSKFQFHLFSGIRRVNFNIVRMKSGFQFVISIPLFGGWTSSLLGSLLSLVLLGMDS